MKELANKYKILLLIIAISLIISITSFSYAYFSMTINSNARENIIISGTMQVEYDDGNVIGTTEKMNPGDEVSKSFSIKNTGNVEANYLIYLSEVVNTFEDRSDLVYQLTSSDGGYSMDFFEECPQTSSLISNTMVSIGVGETHHYVLTIKFINDLENPQDDNHGKIFSSKIGINEYKTDDVSITIHPNNGDEEYTISRKLLRSLGEIEEPIKDDFTFVNWYSDELYTQVVTSSTIVTDELTDIYAKFTMPVGKTITKDYVAPDSNESEVQSYIAEVSGYYQLEAWGAQGGGYNSTYRGGYGAYATGVVHLSEGQRLYIYVGGSGASGASLIPANQEVSGGFNGGGSSGSTYSNKYIGTGGGATHIATEKGLLANLSSYKGSKIENIVGSNDYSYYVSDEILLVAAGGGAGGYQPGSPQGGGVGGDAGGYKGNDGSSTNPSNGAPAYGATQISGGAYQAVNQHCGYNGSFGQGGGICSGNGVGAGGGFFGGGTGGYYGGAGGGSSYIASSNLMSYNTITKHMYCYNCTQVESTYSQIYTISDGTSSCVDTSAREDCAKKDNGYVRITFLGE